MQVLMNENIKLLGVPVLPAGYTQDQQNRLLPRSNNKSLDD